MEIKLQKSKDFTEEYCCSVVRVGVLENVENSDNLKKTRINGESIVVNKTDVHEGDIMLYISNECQITGWFLTANNLYQHWNLNANADVVREKIEKDPEFEKSEEMKNLRGYFGDNGRVRMIKLRGCPSFGVLFKPSALENALPPIAGYDWESIVGVDFDCIESDLALTNEGDKILPFVRAYVPKVNEPRGGHRGNQKSVSKWDRLNRMVPGQFKLHYDTAPLKKHLDDFKPETEITVTVKMHGTSFICGNLLTNYPLRFFKIRRWLNRYLHFRLKESRQDYGMIVSSRKVIKNKWSNCEHPEGYYGVDIWTEYGNIIYPYLPKGVTLYGEICGYVSTAKMVQSGYDYGCKPGENFLMPYRVTEHKDGVLKEYSIEEVGQLTEQIKAAMNDAGDTNVGRIFNILGVRMYEGSVGTLLGERDIKDLPDRLSEIGNIEANEPMCKTKVPREGVVVRIIGDEVAEAFKLKSLRFQDREKKAIDNGEVDMEMQANQEEGSES